MDYHFKGSIVSIACFAAVLFAQGNAISLGAAGADNQASVVAERGGGGGRGGGYHGAGSHGVEGNRVGGEGHYQAGHPDYNRAEFNHENNHDNYNRNDNHYNEFNGGWDHNNWEGAGYGGFGVDVVPEGEYVYPTTTVPPAGTGDMNTLYQQESSTPYAPGN